MQLRYFVLSSEQLIVGVWKVRSRSRGGGRYGKAGGREHKQLMNLVYLTNSLKLPSSTKESGVKTGPDDKIQEPADFRPEFNGSVLLVSENAGTRGKWPNEAIGPVRELQKK